MLLVLVLLFRIGPGGEPSGLGGSVCRPVRDPVVDEEGDVGVRGEVVEFFGGRVGRHYYHREVLRVRRRGEVGVGHEGDVRDVLGRRSEVEEAGVFEALDHLLGQGGGDAHVGVAC